MPASQRGVTVTKHGSTPPCNDKRDQRHMPRRRICYCTYKSVAPSPRRPELSTNSKQIENIPVHTRPRRTYCPRQTNLARFLGRLDARACPGHAQTKRGIAACRGRGLPGSPRACRFDTSARLECMPVCVYGYVGLRVHVHVLVLVSIMSNNRHATDLAPRCNRHATPCRIFILT